MWPRPEFEQTLGDSGRTEEPGVLQSMGSQRVGYDLGAEQQEQGSNEINLPEFK